MGEDYQEGNNKKRRLRSKEIEKIVSTFLNKKNEEDFSKVVTYDQIKEKDYSLSAGQYLDFKIEYVKITQEEFYDKMKKYKQELAEFSSKGKDLEEKIIQQMEELIYEKM